MSDYMEYFRMFCVAFGSVSLYKYIRQPDSNTIRLFIVGAVIFFVGALFMQVKK